MAFKESDVVALAAEVSPPDDDTQHVGKGVMTNVGFTGGFCKVEGVDLPSAQQVYVVSSNAGDTMNVTIEYRTAGGALLSEVIALTGTTPAQSSATMERLMSVTLASQPAGDIAVYASTPEHSGTAQAGGADTIDLAASSSVTDGAYNLHVIRLTGGTGANQVAEIVKYFGSNHRAHLRDWAIAPDATTTYDVCTGIVLEASLSIGGWRRLFWGAAADPLGGATKTRKEKFFLKNANATKDGIGAKLAESTGGAAAKIAFAVEQSLNGTDESGTETRLSWTGGGYTFDSSQKNLGASGDGNFIAGAVQGIWMELSLDAGDTPAKAFYPIELTASST